MAFGGYLGDCGRGFVERGSSHNTDLAGVVEWLKGRVEAAKRKVAFGPGPVVDSSVKILVKLLEFKPLECT